MYRGACLVQESWKTYRRCPVVLGVSFAVPSTVFENFNVNYYYYYFGLKSLIHCHCQVIRVRFVGPPSPCLFVCPSPSLSPLLFPISVLSQLNLASQASSTCIA